MASKVPTPPVPKTFEEFAVTWSGWLDGAIEKVTHGHLMRGTPGADDLKQTVLLRILQQGHIEKFDAATAF